MALPLPYFFKIWKGIFFEKNCDFFFLPATNRIRSSFTNTMEELFTQLIKEHERVIFKITTVYANTEEERKDLYQEIVLQLWKSFKGFKKEAKFSTWMYRVALNTAVTRLRKESKTTTQVPIDQAVLNYTDSQDPLFEERIKLLYKAIENLKPLDKGIILLYLEEKNHQEIAEIIGISVSNVGTKLSRIRQQMKEQIIKSKG